MSTFLIYPSIGDFVASLSIGYAIIFSLMITGYVLSTVAALAKWYEIQNGIAKMCYGGVFLLAHFLPFLTANGNSPHLFLATDVTCVFNYTIPALLNFVLFMYFFNQDKQWKPLKTEARGVLLLALYLAVFSSLFHSIILMSLFGMQLLFALVEQIRENVRQGGPTHCLGFIANYLKIHYPKVLVLVAWLISMVFQLGGRSEDISGQMRLGMIIRAFLEILANRLTPQFRLAVVIINLTAMILACRRRESKFLVKWVQLLGCCLLTVVYIMLVTGKLSDFYFLRSDVIVTWMGLVIVMTLFSLAYLVQKLPKIRFLLPVLLLCMLSMVVFHKGDYQQYNVPCLPSSVIKAIDEDIISQILEAEAEGSSQVQLLVPESLSNGQWPLDVEMTSERISDSLFRHGVTKEKIWVTVVPSPEKDAEFHLD